MMCGWAGRSTVALVRRSLLTLEARVKPHAAYASKAAPQKDAAAQKSAETTSSSAPCAPKNPPQCCDTAFDFVGKTIVVTGAGRGIGRATADALILCGAKVIAVDRNQADLDCLVAESCCGRVIPVTVDLYDWDCTREALMPALDCPIDGTVNNAGVLIKEPFLALTKESVHKQLFINVVALLHVGMLCAQNMVKNKRKGSIVNLASIGSKIGTPTLGVYCTSKGGVAQASRSMAVDLGQYGIRVNSISPTGVNTDMGKEVIEDAAIVKFLQKRTPMGRGVEMCEVVDVILYLLGDRSTFISGANFPVDGGFWVT